MTEWQSGEVNILLKDIITITTNDIPLNQFDHAVCIGNLEYSKKILIRTNKTMVLNGINTI